MSKQDHQIDLEDVQRQFSDQLEGVDLEVSHREIGYGPQYALKAYPEGETSVIWESLWHSPEEFEAYVRGMKNVGLLFRKAERERDE